MTVPQSVSKSLLGTGLTGNLASQQLAFPSTGLGSTRKEHSSAPQGNGAAPSTPEGPINRKFSNKTLLIPKPLCKWEKWTPNKVIEKLKKKKNFTYLNEGPEQKLNSINRNIRHAVPSISVPRTKVTKAETVSSHQTHGIVMNWQRCKLMLPEGAGGWGLPVAQPRPSAHSSVMWSCDEPHSF